MNASTSRDEGRVEESNLSIVRAYLAALEDGASGELLARFFTPDAQQVELPNQLNRNGSTSDLETLMQRVEQGKKLLSHQHYEIQSAISQGTRVAVEAAWSGTLAVPLGNLATGAVMKARFAMFFEFVDGRIRLQRNYDCFEPW